MKIFTMMCAAAFAGLVAAAAAEDMVKASSFGWNAADATKCLEAAIASGARTVRVDKQTGDWVVSHPISLRSDQEIVFEDGVIVSAKPGCFKGITDALFRAKHVTNSVMRGEGRAVLRMRKRDYLDEKQYRSAEWRHCISTQSPVNFQVRNLTVQSSGGDGVYVNGCRNMLVEDVVSDDNLRQGISVISVDGLVVRNCTFKNTWGGLPECGIDIEPHIDRCQVRNVLIENCRFVDNRCHGIAMNLSGLSDKSKEVSITVRNCVSDNNRYHGVWMILSRNTHGAPKGFIRFENVTMKGNATQPISVENLSAGSLKVTFKDCVIDGLSAKKGIQTTTSTDLGGLAFENCTLKIPQGTTPVSFIGATGSGVTDVKGALAIEYDNGAKEKFDLAKWGARFVSKPELRSFRQNADFDIKALYPAKSELALTEKDGWNPVIRGGATLLVRAPAKGEYKLYFKIAKVGPKWNPDGGSIIVYDAQGTTHDQAKLKPFGEVTEYTLKSQGALMFTIKVSAGGFGGFQYRSSFPGTAVLVKDRVDFLATKKVPLYFAVPAGSEEVKVEFSMAPGEPMTGRLLDPEGKVVDEVKTARQLALLNAKFPKTSKPQVWCLMADNFLDDGHVRIGGDAIPAVSYCKDGVLLPKGMK